MEKIDLINSFVRTLLITFFIYLTYEKITNYKNINYIIIFIASTIISIIYLVLDKYIPRLITIIVLYTIYGMIINKTIKIEMNYISYIFSCVISYLIYLISVLIVGIFTVTICKKEILVKIVGLLIIPIVFTLLFYAIFSRRRFKDGFNFLKNNDINKNIKKFALFCIGIIIIFLAFLLKLRDIVLRSYIFVGGAFIISSIFFWIKNQITITYKNHMRDRTIEMQKAEIDEQARIMEELKAENLKLASAVHKYNKKFSSLEFAMKNLETNTEFSDELSVIIDETKEAAENFAKEVETKINKLPLTNNVGIDNMLKYMQEEARKKDINFDLKLNISINPLLETTITKDKFETLIGDHLKDAIIAVDKSEKSYKSILVTLSLLDGIYEFSVYDTGIEFEIDTLLKLGKEQVTTHKDEGGSGIGFMTTFETLKECKASLVIEEYNPETTNYTKSITIKFDGKNEYRIYSYRAEKIKEQKTKRRIIIEKLK